VERTNCLVLFKFVRSWLLFPQLGGTIGDIEGMPFVEAFRQFQFRVKQENFCNIHVSLVPEVSFVKLILCTHSSGNACYKCSNCFFEELKQNQS